MGNEIVTASRGILPQSIGEALQLADLMASAKLVPVHLRNSPGDCLLVINQAIRWGLDPVTVAQATAVVQGKLCYEGKLVAAVLVSTGAIRGRPDYVFSGEGDDRAITVSATSNDGKVRSVTGCVRDWKTGNQYWRTQPDDMLIYRGIRQWARRYAPEAMLGIVTPDEMEPDDHAKSEPPPKTGRKPAQATAQVIPDNPMKHDVPQPEVTLDAEEVMSDIVESSSAIAKFMELIEQAETLEAISDIKSAMQIQFHEGVPKGLRDAWANRKKALRPV